jgi:hypothetical protein
MMINGLRKVFRKNGYTGEFGTDTGSIRFSEDNSGEGFFIEVWNSDEQEAQRVYISASDIYTIAQIGLVTESFTTEELLEEIPEIVKKNEERKRHMQEMAEKRTKMWRPSMPIELESDYDAAHADLPGGDGTPEYYAVEGWGIIKLDNGDFEVSYKV